MLDDPFFARSTQRELAHQVRRGFEGIKLIPHRAFSGQDEDGVPGSNNWVISGALTDSGRPIVSNDTHLALRNPELASSPSPFAPAR